MAITNAQQFKQLVNPPMKGKKRPGYRGDDAYGGGDSVAGGGDQGFGRDGPPGPDDRSTAQQTANKRAQVRDLDAIVEKLNTTFQEELKQEVEAFNFFLQ